MSPSVGAAAGRIVEHCDKCAARQSRGARVGRAGGGARGVEARIVADHLVVVHIIVDCQDAMGANLVNTVAEAVADRLAEIAKATVGLRILSNLCDKRCVRVSCRVPGRSPRDRRDGRKRCPRRHRRRVAICGGGSVPRRNPQQGHHERRRRGHHRHRQ